MVSVLIILKFKLINKRQAVTVWKFETFSEFASDQREIKQFLCQDGRSRGLPNVYCQPSVRKRVNSQKLSIKRVLLLYWCLLGVI